MRQRSYKENICGRWESYAIELAFVLYSRTKAIVSPLTIHLLFMNSLPPLNLIPSIRLPILPTPRLLLCLDHSNVPETYLY